MSERPELLTVEHLRDYVIGLRDRDRWVPLGEHYAPGFLVGTSRKVVCDVYGVGLDRKVENVDLPVEIRHLNSHFFSADFCGLSRTPRQLIFQSETLSGEDLPVLWRICGKDFRETYDGVTDPTGRLPLVDYWWNHPGRRRYERIVVVPR